MANIVLNGKTYTARGIVNSISQWVEESLGVVSGFSPLTGSVKLGRTASKAQPAARSVVKWVINLPTVATEASACACPGDVLASSLADITLRIDPLATAADRADLLARVQGLVLKTEFTASVTSLAQPIP